MRFWPNPQKLDLGDGESISAEVLGRSLGPKRCLGKASSKELAEVMMFRTEKEN